MQDAHMFISRYLGGLDMSAEKRVQEQYEIAREQYAQLGANTDRAIELADKIPISIHCWQGDDITEFEDPVESLQVVYR